MMNLVQRLLDLTYEYGANHRKIFHQCDANQVLFALTPKGKDDRKQIHLHAKAPVTLNFCL